MVEFTYKAVTDSGGHINASVEAVDRRAAVTALSQRGHFVTELTEKIISAEQVEQGAAGWNLGQFLRFGSKRITGKDILAITSQLSTALRAGLPLLNALEIIGAQQHKAPMKKLLAELAHSISSGESLSDAMSKYPKIFSALYLSMIRVGETGGILDDTIRQLSGLLSREEKVKSNIKNASAYPIFVVCLGLISVAVVVIWILPKILATISGGTEILPLPTRMLMVMSSFLKSFGLPLVVLLVAGGFYFKRWKASAEGRFKWDGFRLKVPIFGAVLRTIAVGRFARTLGALTKSGIAILESLKVVRDTLGNEVLGRQVDKVAEAVRTGRSLAEPLAESGHFPALLVQIVSIGEQTGKLDELLLNAAETFDDEADAAIMRFMAIFPAVLILILGVVIAFIIAATLLPIVQMELGAGGF